MKKLYAVIITLLFVASVCGITSFMAVPIDPPLPPPPPPAGTSTYAATPETVQVGEFITVTNHITGYWDAHTPIQDFTIYGTGGVVKISGPEPTNVPTIEVGESIDIVWVYKATGSGKVAFGTEEKKLTNYVDILPKPAPMKQLMKILGLGQKD